jgi:hypothetical protein
MGAHTDQRGNRSSKRVYGGAMIIAGVFCLVYAALRGGQSTVDLPEIETAVTAGQWLVCVGAALLGVSLVEWFAKPKQ